MRLARKAAIIALLLLLPGLALASKGVVVYYKSGCSYFLVETSMGYALLEWYGGYDPSRGDTVAGDIDSYGMKTIYNLTADRETRVWIDDYMLSKSSAIEKYFDKCN